MKLLLSTKKYLCTDNYSYKAQESLPDCVTIHSAYQILILPFVTKMYRYEDF